MAINTRSLELRIKAIDEFSGKMNRLQDKLEDIARVAKRVFLGIAGVVIGSVASFVRLEEQIAFISTMLSGKASQYIDKFEEGIKKMAVDFGESTASLSTGLFNILSATIQPSKALEVLRGATMAAKAGFTDVATIIPAVTKALLAYGKQGYDVTRITDIMFGAFDRGQFTLAELAQVLPDVTSTSKLLNISMEESAGTIAFLSKGFGSVSQAATGYEAIVSRIVNPTKDFEEKLNELGLTSLQVRDMVGEKGLYATIQEIIRRDPGKQLVASLFNEKEAMKAISVMMQGAHEWQEDLEWVFNSAGLTQEKFAKAVETLTFIFNQLKQAVFITAVTFGKQWKPEIVSAVEWIRKLIEKMQSLTPEQWEQIKTWTKIALAITGVLAILPGIVTVVVSLTKAYAGLKIASLFISTVTSGTLIPALIGIAPILLPLIAIAGALYLAYKNNFLGIANVINETIEYWKPIVVSVGERVKQVAIFIFNTLTHLGKAWDIIWTSMLVSVISVVNSMNEFIAPRLNTFINIWYAVYQQVAALTKNFGGAIKKGMIAIAGTLDETVQLIGDFGNLIQAIIDKKIFEIPRLFKKYQESMAEFSFAVGDASVNIMDSIKGLSTAQIETKDFIDIDKITVSTGELDKKLGDLVTGAVFARDSWTSFGLEIKNTQMKTGESSKSINELEKSLGALPPAVKEVVRAEKELDAQLAKDKGRHERALLIDVQLTTTKLKEDLQARIDAVKEAIRAEKELDEQRAKDKRRDEIVTINYVRFYTNKLKKELQARIDAVKEAIRDEKGLGGWAKTMPIGGPGEMVVGGTTQSMDNISEGASQASIDIGKLFSQITTLGKTLEQEFEFKIDLGAGRDFWTAFGHWGEGAMAALKGDYVTMIVEIVQMWANLIQTPLEAERARVARQEKMTKEAIGGTEQFKGWIEQGKGLDTLIDLSNEYLKEWSKNHLDEEHTIKLLEEIGKIQLENALKQIEIITQGYNYNGKNFGDTINQLEEITEKIVNNGLLDQEQREKIWEENREAQLEVALETIGAITDSFDINSDNIVGHTIETIAQLQAVEELMRTDSSLTQEQLDQIREATQASYDMLKIQALGAWEGLLQHMINMEMITEDQVLSELVNMYEQNGEFMSTQEKWNFEERIDNMIDSLINETGILEKLEKGQISNLDAQMGFIDQAKLQTNGVLEQAIYLQNVIMSLENMGQDSSLVKTALDNLNLTEEQRKILDDMYGNGQISALERLHNLQDTYFTLSLVKLGLSLDEIEKVKNGTLDVKKVLDDKIAKDSTLRNIQLTPTGSGVGGSPTNISNPPMGSYFQEGGIAWHPQLAWVGEKEPEFIIPFSKARREGTSSKIEVNVPITINNPQVREDRDIDELAYKVAEVVTPLISEAIGKLARDMGNVDLSYT